MNDQVECQHTRVVPFPDGSGGICQGCYKPIPSDTMLEKIRAVKELYNWQHVSNADWFTAQLFNLWMKADGGNRTRLARGFPVECEVITEWIQSDNPDQWFRGYGVKK